jgi:hypothetical protein
VKISSIFFVKVPVPDRKPVCALWGICVECEKRVNKIKGNPLFCQQTQHPPQQQQQLVLWRSSCWLTMEEARFTGGWLIFCGFLWEWHIWQIFSSVQTIITLPDKFQFYALQDVNI